MTTEPKDKTETTNDKTEQPEANVEPVQAEEESIEAIKAERDKAKEEATRQQKAAMEFSKKARDLEGLRATVDGLKEYVSSGFGTIADYLDEVKVQGSEDYEEKPKARPSYKERLQELNKPKENPEAKATEAVVKAYAKEIIKILPPGVEFDKDPRFQEAFTQFENGEFGEALIKTKETVSKMSDTKDDKDKTIAELQEKLTKYEERKKAIDSGELSSETSLPSGSTKGKKPTLEELQASDPFETQKKIASGEWVW